MRPLTIHPHKCKIIFFDLEFYVPTEGRDRKGFCYNPWIEGHKLLGGSFYIANPKTDLVDELRPSDRRIKSSWLWNYSSERALIQSIYSVLVKTHDVVLKQNGGKVSPILCGIGIISSDVPILFELFKRYKLLSNSDAFYFQNKFRVLDISQLAIATFNNNSDFLYPKQKKLILNKYIPEQSFADGKSVWDLYDAGEYSQIESRVHEEVAVTQQSYIKILSDYRKFKGLERFQKRAERDRAKELLAGESVK